MEHVQNSVHTDELPNTPKIDAVHFDLSLKRNPPLARKLFFVAARCSLTTSFGIW
jgi:hypothetical protein